MKLFYQLEKFGNKHKKYKKTQAKSFVKAFQYNLYTSLSALSSSTTDIYNATQALQYNSYSICFLSGGGGNTLNTVYSAFSGSSWMKNNNVGIVVGSGNTGVTSTDYKLGTPITYGITSGLLESNSHTFTPVVISAPSASFTVNRIFRNSSGGNVTINEIGLYGFMNSSSRDFAEFCIVRDVLGVPVTMANGDYLKVTYTFQITA